MVVTPPTDARPYHVVDHAAVYVRRTSQVVGRKYVRLYAPGCGASLRPFPKGSMNSNSSSIDLDMVVSRCAIARQTLWLLVEALPARPSCSFRMWAQVPARVRPCVRCRLPPATGDAAVREGTSGSGRHEAVPTKARASGAARDDGGAATAATDGAAPRGDEATAPPAEELPFLDTVLGPGDMLFIPVQWYHFVRSLSVSFSVSHWWS
jgi:hypothetical protein